MVKKITDEDLILYLENDLSKKRMNEVRIELQKNKALLNRLNSFERLNEDMTSDIDQKYKMPSSFKKEMDNIIAHKFKQDVPEKKKFIEIFNKFSPFSLISGSFISGAALTSILMLIFAPLFTTTTLVTRGSNEVSSLPTQWAIGEEILLSVVKENKVISSDIKSLELKINSKISFNIISTVNMNVDILYINSLNKKSILYSNLVLHKGKTFITDTFTVTEPLGIDKLQILQKNKIIFEQKIKIIE